MIPVIHWLRCCQLSYVNEESDSHKRTQCVDLRESEVVLLPFWFWIKFDSKQAYRAAVLNWYRPYLTVFFNQKTLFVLLCLLRSQGILHSFSGTDTDRIWPYINSLLITKIHTPPSDDVQTQTHWHLWRETLWRISFQPQLRVSLAPLPTWVTPYIWIIMKSLVHAGYLLLYSSLLVLQVFQLSVFS